jgi:hypothetical protein
MDRADELIGIPKVGGMKAGRAWLTSAVLQVDLGEVSSHLSADHAKQHPYI